MDLNTPFYSLGLFQAEIKRLIDLRKEGEYWDFKEKWHDCNADLLHDILCMSNTQHIGHRYIIIGVTNTFEIKGVKEDVERKTQVKLIDFLDKIAFAGDVRPEIAVHEISFDGKMVDIVVVFDQPKKPYFLSRDYSSNKITIRAGAIYTRVGDKNTAKNRTADISDVEKMWKQRFGLNLAPVDRFKQLLTSPEDWECDFDNKARAYHKNFPEFQIEISELEEREGESFCYFYPNEKSYWGTAYFKYQNTIIFELSCVKCDEMRIFLPVPEIHTFLWPHDYDWFYYYLLDGKSGLFLEFLSSQRCSRFESRGGKAPIFVFNDKEEKDAFLKDVKENKDSIEKIEPDFLAKRILEKWGGDRIGSNAIFISKLEKFYKSWFHRSKSEDIHNLVIGNVTPVENTL